MERDVRRGRMTLDQAARKLGRESDGCRLCDPDNCREHYFGDKASNGSRKGAALRSKYWRFDRSHPEFSNPTTLTLKSIPDGLRIPPSRFGDIGAYFAEKYALSKETNSSMDYLVEYNPSLAAIPQKMKRRLPSEAVYLLSLRVTPANNCFPADMYASLPKDVWRAVYHTSLNHLGLALLDADLRMLPGYEAVIEIDAPFDLKRPTTTKAGDAVSPTFMDYRLFALNDEIYLHANSDTVVVNRLEISSRDHVGEGDAREESCEAVAAEAGEMGNWERPCAISNLHGGDRLRVTIMRQFNTVWSGGIYGKNYALFGVPNVTHPEEPDDIYAEVDIFPHRVQRILPDEHVQLSKQAVFDRIWKPGTHKRRNFKIDRVNMRGAIEVGNASVSDGPPLPSFFTADAHEDWFPGDPAFKEGAHGGACCVRFSADELGPGNGRALLGEAGGADHLLVGIGHTKVTWKPWYNRPSTTQEQKDRLPHTHYVSLFYAFAPRPPFRIVARSGYFCLGHAPPSEEAGALPRGEGGTFNPHSVLTRNRMLMQNNVTFDCPQMHFVSTFVEKHDDPSATVVGYGLNDCTGRLVEVAKAEVARMLRPDPSDMLFER